MATIKSFTSLEQSKKLAQILPLESADYHYITQGEKSYLYPYSLSSDAIKDYDEEIKYIPCWSLAALLDVLPEYNLQRTDWGNKIECKIVVTINDDNYGSKNYYNPVDACYELILKLHGLNLL